jgi:hypothetical protein
MAESENTSCTVSGKELMKALGWGANNSPQAIESQLLPFLQRRSIKLKFNVFMEECPLNASAPNDDVVVSRSAEVLRRGLSHYSIPLDRQARADDNWKDEDFYVWFVTELVKTERLHGGIWNSQRVGEYETENQCATALKILVCRGLFISLAFCSHSPQKYLRYHKDVYSSSPKQQDNAASFLDVRTDLAHIFFKTKDGRYGIRTKDRSYPDEGDSDIEPEGWSTLQYNRSSRKIIADFSRSPASTGYRGKASFSLPAETKAHENLVQSKLKILSRTVRDRYDLLMDLANANGGLQNDIVFPDRDGQVVSDNNDDHATRLVDQFLVDAENSAAISEDEDQDEDAALDAIRKRDDVIFDGLTRIDEIKIRGSTSWPWNCKYAINKMPVFSRMLCL